MTTIRGIDIASHQGPGIDFSAVRDAGYEFVVVKVTGGKSYVNPHFARQFNGARLAGLAVGIYHYEGESSFPIGTPEQEAEHFLAHLPNPLPPGTFLVLDAEDDATKSADRYLRWLRAVKAATGITPLFYTYPYFINNLPNRGPLQEFPLWYASYPNGTYHPGDALPPSPPVPWPWDWYVMWQYSGGMYVPGSPIATDANVFYGEREALAALGQPQAAPTDGTTTWELNAKGETIAHINFGGVARAILGINFADVGASVVGTDGRVYDRSLIGGVFQPWTVRE